MNDKVWVVTVNMRDITYERCNLQPLKVVDTVNDDNYIRYVVKGEDDGVTLAYIRASDYKSKCSYFRDKPEDIINDLFVAIHDKGSGSCIITLYKDEPSDEFKARLKSLHDIMCSKVEWVKKLRDCSDRIIREIYHNNFACCDIEFICDSLLNTFNTVNEAYRTKGDIQ